MKDRVEVALFMQYPAAMQNAQSKLCEIIMHLLQACPTIHLLFDMLTKGRGGKRGMVLPTDCFVYMDSGAFWTPFQIHEYFFAATYPTSGFSIGVCDLHNSTCHNEEGFYSFISCSGLPLFFLSFLTTCGYCSAVCFSLDGRVLIHPLLTTKRWRLSPNAWSWAQLLYQL